MADIVKYIPLSVYAFILACVAMLVYKAYQRIRIRRTENKIVQSIRQQLEQQQINEKGDN